MSDQATQDHKPAAKSQEEIAKELLKILKEERCPASKFSQELKSCILQTYPLALQLLIKWTIWGSDKANRSFESIHKGKLEQMAKGHHVDITVRKIIVQCELEVQTKLLHEGGKPPKTEEIYREAVLILELLQTSILKKIQSVQKSKNEDK